MTSKKLGMEMHEIALNPFPMHLSDAILAAHLAKHAKSFDEIRSMHSRTAVIHSVFALECAANCFLGRVPRNHHFRDKAEMWPALDKFDLFLLSIPKSPQLPRGSAQVKAVQELIKFRDKHVHPRSIRCPISESEDPELTFRMQWPQQQTTTIKPMSFLWDAEDARHAVAIILDFLRLFFELAALPYAQIEAALFSFIVCADGNRRADVGKLEKILTLAATIDLDVTFLTKSPRS